MERPDKGSPAGSTRSSWKEVFKNRNAGVVFGDIGNDQGVLASIGSCARH
jgi:hypothetical protein